MCLVCLAMWVRLDPDSAKCACDSLFFYLGYWAVAVAAIAALWSFVAIALFVCIFLLRLLPNAIELCGWVISRFCVQVQCRWNTNVSNVQFVRQRQPYLSQKNVFAIRYRLFWSFLSFSSCLWNKTMYFSNPNEMFSYYFFDRSIVCWFAWMNDFKIFYCRNMDFCVEIWRQNAWQKNNLKKPENI